MGKRSLSCARPPCDTQAVQNNGSVYLHAFFAPTGLPLDPKDPDHDAQTVFQRTESAHPRARRPLSFGLVFTAELSCFHTRAWPLPTLGSSSALTSCHL
jgi:hypothetical protein